MTSTLTAPIRTTPTPGRTPVRRDAGRRDAARPDAASGRTRIAAGLALVALVGAGVAGARLALPLVEHPGEQAALAALADPATPGLGTGQHIRTSFGSLTVDEAQIFNGLSSDDLGGMSHGVSSLVSSGKAQVTVVVTLTAQKSAAVVSAGQFALLHGRGDAPTGAPTTAAGTTFPAGQLPRRASVDGRISFVTPTDGSQLWLQYTDPGTHQVARIALGQAATIGPDTHAHHAAVAPLPLPPS